MTRSRASLVMSVMLTEGQCIFDIVFSHAARGDRVCADVWPYRTACTVYTKPHFTPTIVCTNRRLHQTRHALYTKPRFAPTAIYTKQRLAPTRHGLHQPRFTPNQQLLCCWLLGFLLLLLLGGLLLLAAALFVLLLLLLLHLPLPGSESTSIHAGGFDPEAV